MKRLAIIASVGGLVLLLFAVAMAQGGPGPDGGRQMRRPPILFGTITGIDSNSVTIHPEIPEQMRQRMEENGRELPKLPESITVKFNDQTKWYFDGKEGSRTDFSKGDQIVVKVGKGDQNSAAAEIIADPGTAREFIMQRIQERRGGGSGMGMGPGQGRGEGRQMRRPPVLFGTITELSQNSLTIHPEMPEQMKQRMEQRREQRGREMPQLPESITLNVGPDTKWYLDGKAAERADFSKGDKAVIKVSAGEGTTPVAEIVADPKTARELIMKKLQGRRQGRDGEGRQGMGMGPGGGQEMGPGDGQAMGRGMGHGMPGEGRQMRPHFGAITEITEDSVTIKPEIPDFVAAKMKERGVEPPKDLPKSLTFQLTPETRIVKDGERAEWHDYQRGERIVLRSGAAENGEPCALMIADLMTAKKMMERMVQGPAGQGKQEQGRQQGRARKTREAQRGRSQSK